MRNNVRIALCTLLFLSPSLLVRFEDKVSFGCLEMLLWGTIFIFLWRIILWFRLNNTLKASIQIRSVCSSQTMSCKRLKHCAKCFFIPIIWIVEKKKLRKRAFSIISQSNLTKKPHKYKPSLSNFKKLLIYRSKHFNGRRQTIAWYCKAFC